MTECSFKPGNLKYRHDDDLSTGKLFYLSGMNKLQRTSNDAHAFACYTHVKPVLHDLLEEFRYVRVTVLDNQDFRIGK